MGTRRGLNRDVEPGQIWADLDPRQIGRKIVVDEVLGMFAHGRVVADRDGQIRSSIGRPVRVRLDRFWPTSRGYERDGSTVSSNGQTPASP